MIDHAELARLEAERRRYAYPGRVGADDAYGAERLRVRDVLDRHILRLRALAASSSAGLAGTEGDTHAD